EDLLIHGDSVYDIIEKQDHQTIQNELVRASNPLNVPNDSRIFLCRMNVSRNSRRQMRFGDQKVVLVEGHFVSYLPLCSRNEPVFLATCTPVAMPETRECVVQGSTNVFTSIHSMDMKFIHLDGNGEFHLGYNKSQMKNLSWYDIVHWENLSDAQSKHRLITQSEQERSCILLLRLQTSSLDWIWVHVVLQVKDNNENSQQPVIVCTNQVLSEKEAAVMQANNWLYQFYSLHSKLHYTMQNSNVSVSASNSSPTSTPVPSHSPTPPSYETATNQSSQVGSNGTARPFPPYSPSSFSSTQSAVGHHHHHPYHSIPTAGSEAPSLALHPTHPNMSYYHGHANNGMGVSVSTNPGSHQYPNHFGSHSSGAQYSPQAGSLPYQTTPNQTNTTPSTPPASSQTEIRVKEEPVNSVRTTKRGRSTSNQDQDDQQKRSKNHKKNSSSHNGHEHSSTPTSTTSVNGSATNSNGSTSTNGSYTSSYGNGTHSSYGAYHPTGSMFGTSGFTHSDLSSMMPAYYGGTMSYHHSQLAYPHHFQGKFSFFEHGTAGSNGPLTGGSDFDHREANTDPNRSDRGSSGGGGSSSQHQESATVLSSTFRSTLPHINKPKCNMAMYGTADLTDRRDLDKVRSPESITSTTSDYGSMTSQSPPSTFDQKSTTITPLSHSETSNFGRSHYHNSLKNNWHGYQSSIDISVEDRSSLPFSMSFQFWPGYSSVSSTDLAHQPIDGQHRHPHHHHHHHPHIPSVASTFPVDSLLTHSHTNQTTSSYGHGNLFGYGDNGHYESTTTNTNKSLVNRSHRHGGGNKGEGKLNCNGISSASSTTATTKPPSASQATAITATRAL
ncbi:hypothetical protein BLOT_004838, partial [Blomia tropicalis]